MEAWIACSGLTPLRYCIPRLLIDLYSQTSLMPSFRRTTASALPEKLYSSQTSGTSSRKDSSRPSRSASRPARFRTSATTWPRSKTRYRLSGNGLLGSTFSALYHCCRTQAPSREPRQRRADGRPIFAFSLRARSRTCETFIRPATSCTYRCALEGTRYTFAGTGLPARDCLDCVSSSTRPP